MNKDKIGFFRPTNWEYYYINSSGETYKSEEFEGIAVMENRRSVGNCYETEDQAKNKK